MGAKINQLLPETTMRSFTDLCTMAFERLRSPVDGALNVSFYAMDRATPSLHVVECRPEVASFYAEGQIPGHEEVGAITCGMTPGEVRVGLIMPPSAVFGDAQSLKMEISHAYDGLPADIIRTLPGRRTLFDRVFNEAPFDAHWMRQALEDDAAAQMLVERLSYIVSTIWRTGMQVLADAGMMELSDTVLVWSAVQLQPHDICKKFHVVIVDSARQEDGRWVTVLRSNLPANFLEKAMNSEGYEVTVSSVEDVQEMPELAA
ncbi:hypothetical protein D7S70_22485 [Ralstonia pickettii]|jgi:hypothetical protein|nr:hypothetical protein [Ralstonia mannitolilytica]MBA9915680.1 hypothetical protein [Ralstonia insidiosa]MBA9954671.1 hypothetical protein [Ralstonia insidiosa]MBA9971183.1 hypothetical protein [Ralstonia insidiosa]MBB0130551.1 hypothetical protein [Ralstonia pickettii]